MTSCDTDACSCYAIEPQTQNDSDHYYPGDFHLVPKREMYLLIGQYKPHNCFREVMYGDEYCKKHTTPPHRQFSCTLTHLYGRIY